MNAYAKFWGDKQRALWYVMVFSGVVNFFDLCFLFSFFFQLEAYVHTNAEITYLFTQPIRVDRTLVHSGERFQKARCGLSERTHWFCVQGRPIRVKNYICIYAVSKKFRIRVDVSTLPHCHKTLLTR